MPLALAVAAAMYLSGCTSRQTIAEKEREIRELITLKQEQQVALARSQRTVEVLREELDASKQERRELAQSLARWEATAKLQERAVDRLEARNAKLQETQRHLERSFERLEKTHDDLDRLFNATVRELATERSARQLLSLEQDLGRQQPYSQPPPRSGAEERSYSARDRDLERLRDQLAGERDRQRADVQARHNARQGAVVERLTPVRDNAGSDARPSPPADTVGDASDGEDLATDESRAADTGFPFGTLILFLCGLTIAAIVFVVFRRRGKNAAEQATATIRAGLSQPDETDTEAQEVEAATPKPALETETGTDTEEDDALESTGSPSKPGENDDDAEPALYDELSTDASVEAADPTMAKESETLENGGSSPRPPRLDSASLTYPSPATPAESDGFIATQVLPRDLAADQLGLSGGDQLLTDLRGDRTDSDLDASQTPSVAQPETPPADEQADLDNALATQLMPTLDEFESEFVEAGDPTSDTIDEPAELESGATLDLTADAPTPERGEQLVDDDFDQPGATLDLTADAPTPERGEQLVDDDFDQPGATLDLTADVPTPEGPRSSDDVTAAEGPRSSDDVTAAGHRSKSAASGAEHSYASQLENESLTSNSKTQVAGTKSEFKADASEEHFGSTQVIDLEHIERDLGDDLDDDFGSTQVIDTGSIAKVLADDFDDDFGSTQVIDTDSVQKVLDDDFTSTAGLHEEAKVDADEDLGDDSAAGHADATDDDFGSTQVIDTDSLQKVVEDEPDDDFGSTQVIDTDSVQNVIKDDFDDDFGSTQVIDTDSVREIIEDEPDDDFGSTQVIDTGSVQKIVEDDFDDDFGSTQVIDTDSIARVTDDALDEVRQDRDEEGNLEETEEVDPDDDDETKDVIELTGSSSNEIENASRSLDSENLSIEKPTATASSDAKKEQSTTAPTKVKDERSLLAELQAAVLANPEDDEFSSTQVMDPTPSRSEESDPLKDTSSGVSDGEAPMCTQVIDSSAENHASTTAIGLADALFDLDDDHGATQEIERLPLDAPAQGAHDTDHGAHSTRDLISDLEDIMDEHLDTNP